MAKYKVDKKLFDQRVLEEQLKQIELQSKYLKDEPLKRSEVDEYNKLKTNGWIKNSLISLGVVFATAIAFVIFTLLGNMLMTNGRTGDVNANSLNSIEIYNSFVSSEYYPEPSTSTTSTVFVDYPVPSNFLESPNDDVYITYRLDWRQSYDGMNRPVDGSGSWIVGKTGKTVGYLTQSTKIGLDNKNYILDAKKVDLNTLMTDWFKGQKDGWAKKLIEDYFYTAWPLTLVLWLVFILSIFGYAALIVVGIRYIIRSVINVLRKTGYIASDFVTEVVDTVKAEIPVVEVDKPEDVDFTKMKEELTKKLKEGKTDFDTDNDIEKKEISEEKKDNNLIITSNKKTKDKIKPKEKEKSHVIENDKLKEKETKKKIKKVESEKKAEEKIKDIFS